MKTFALAIAVMGLCIAVAMADDPTAGQSAIDVHYLDHDFKSYQMTTGVLPGTLLIILGVGVVVAFVSSTHKTGTDNGQSGSLLSIEGFLFILLIVAAFAKMTGVF